MDRIQSGYGVLKELVTIIVGVAIGNIVISAGSLATGVSKSAPVMPPFSEPSSSGYVLLGWALVLLAVRFYHGNMRSLDEESVDDTREKQVNPIVDVGEIKPMPETAETIASGPTAANAMQEGPPSFWQQLRSVLLTWANSTIKSLRGHAFVQMLEFIVVIMQGAILVAFGILLPNTERLSEGVVLLLLSDIGLLATDFLARGRLRRYKIIWLVLNIASVVVLGAQRLFYLPFAPTMVGVIIVGTLADYLLNATLYFPRSSE